MKKIAAKEAVELQSIKENDSTRDAKKRIVDAIFLELKNGKINLIDMVELAGMLCRETAYLVRKSELKTSKKQTK